jgi:peptidyl-prolyl cis-trans isomerase D
MSVIQRIRDKGTWIIFAVIAIALIAFILQDGMGSRGGSIFGNSNTVGSVNGTSISKEEFDQKLTMYSRGQDKSTIIPQLWNMEVEKILMESEYQKLGLQVSGKELSDVLFGPQSPLSREQQFVDENGQFKAEEARQAFAQLKKSKNAEQIQGVIQGYIEPTQQQILNKKYQALTQNAVYVPSWLVEKQKAENSAISNISYVFVPYATISDSAVNVSDNEIEAYVKKHPSGFEKEEETRAISYINFDAKPSASDSLNALNQVMSYQSEFETTADVKSFIAKSGSEIPYLDGYVMKSGLKMPKADSIKALADGKTFGPYLDASNYTLARMLGRRVLPDSVKVRHILVKTQDKRQQVLPDSVAKKRMDSVEALIKGGADFNSIVQKYSDDDGSKKTKGEYDFTLQQFTGISKEFAEAIFYGKTGDKKVVKLENDAYAGYHYIEVLSQKAIGEAVKVAYLAKSISASNETINAATTAALQFASTAKSKKDFDENAKKLNSTPLVFTEIKENDFTIAPFGQVPVRNLIRWVYENKVGAVSEPTEVGDKYVVAIITNISKKGSINVAELRPRVEGYVRNEKKAKQIIESKFKGNTLESFVASSGTTIQKADSLSFANPTIPNIGYDVKVLGAAFNKDNTGKATEPIAASSGVISLKVESLGAKPSMQDDESIKQSLLQGQKNAAYRGSEALRKSATIKDYRSKFY